MAAGRTHSVVGAQAIGIALDPKIRLLVPEHDVAEPELSIVVPALDEEITVGEFVDWCRQGLERAGVIGEVLIVDSSSDRTAEIALAHGARVLRTPLRGLGRAYIDALPFIRGRFVLMGDADCTYDFRNLAPFVEKLRDGYEFVMGSRFKGEIEPGAMPALHRYFGSPITTRVLNVLSGTSFSDIHCGMRAMTIGALRRVDLQSEGWEYASEMILRAGDLGLRSTEVPITFLRDRGGRISNVKRGGWLTPWIAGWDSLRTMFTHRADFFLLRPGLVFTIVGILGVAALATGPIEMGPVRLTLHSQMLFFALVVIGLASVYMAILVRLLYGRYGDTPSRLVGLVSYTRTVLLSGVLIVTGLAIDLAFLVSYIRNEFRIDRSDAAFSHLATTGLLLIVVGYMTFTSALVIHATATRRPRLPHQRGAAVTDDEADD